MKLEDGKYDKINWGIDVLKNCYLLSFDHQFHGFVQAIQKKKTSAISDNIISIDNHDDDNNNNCVEQSLCSHYMISL